MYMYIIIYLRYVYICILHCIHVCHIFVGTYDPYDSNRTIMAAPSLFVIVSSPPINPDYGHFHQQVNWYNEQPPFAFPNPFQLPKKVS